MTQQAKTVEQCKRMLFKAGIQLGVSPTLISTRLLSDEDKLDMQQGLISDESLVTAVKVWMESRMPEYAKGSYRSYRRL